jgi:hypothetical protein
LSATMIPRFLSINTRPARQVRSAGVMKPKFKIENLGRWVARGLAVCLLLFWGAFFVEHLREWFIAPFPNHPPLKVCLTVALHALLLIGLILTLRWELAGSLIVLAAGGAFFFVVAGKSAPLFFGVTALPALLSLWCWRHRLRNAVQPPTHASS